MNKPSSMASAVASRNGSGSEDVRSDLCAICLQALADSRLLPCLHSFCCACIDQLALRSTEDEQVICPVCRTACSLPENGAAGLTKDFTLSPVKSLPQVCVVCAESESNRSSHVSKEDGAEKGEEPVAWCRNCKQPVCAKHMVEHFTSPGNHVLGSLDEREESRSDRDDDADDRCPIHNLPLRYYCIQCESAVCADCTFIADHRSHERICLLEEVLAKQKDTTLSKVDVMRSSFELPLKASLQAVEEANTVLSAQAEEAKEKIRSSVMKAVSAVELVGQQLIQKVDDVRTVCGKSLEQRREVISEQLAAVRNVVIFRQRLQAHHGHAASTLSLIHALANRVTQVMAQYTYNHLDSAEAPCLATGASPPEDTLILAAEKLVCCVLPCRASAAHSEILGASKRECKVGESFTVEVITKDSNGQLCEKGDLVLARWLELEYPGRPTSQAINESIHAVYKGGGLYELSVTARQSGRYRLQVSVNHTAMAYVISIQVPNAVYLTFDPSECHEKVLINPDRRSAAFNREPVKNSVYSVLGTPGLRHGCHMWKVRIGDTSNQHGVGVAMKPLSRLYNNWNETWAWDSNGREVARGCGTYGAWELSTAQDTMKILLDCDEHLITITNLRSGATRTITGLPDVELFPYFTVYQQGNSLTLVD